MVLKFQPYDQVTFETDCPENGTKLTYGFFVGGVCVENRENTVLVEDDQGQRYIRDIRDVRANSGWFRGFAHGDIGEVEHNE